MLSLQPSTSWHWLAHLCPGSSQKCPISRVKIWTGRALVLWGKGGEAPEITSRRRIVKPHLSLRLTSAISGNHSQLRWKDVWDDDCLGDLLNLGWHMGIFCCCVHIFFLLHFSFLCCFVSISFVLSFFLIVVLCCVMMIVLVTCWTQGDIWVSLLGRAAVSGGDKEISSAMRTISLSHPPNFLFNVQHDKQRSQQPNIHWSSLH